MNKFIKDISNKVRLSGEDVLRICENRANILSYHQLTKYRNIDQVLGDYGAVVLLYEHKGKKNIGHWTCLFRDKNDKELLHFFDPYGVKMDGQIDILKNGSPKYISMLIEDSPYRVIYNNYPLQKLGEGINTCGRYVGIRLLCRNMSDLKFIKMFSGKHVLDSDSLISAITMLL